jgi:hypothetical protein
MNFEEIRETTAWGLYEKGRNYHRLMGYYVDTDRNYRMYNGNQWEHAKLGDVEPVQKNFIKSVVKYKVGVIHDNLYAINYSSQNFENREFRKQAEKICEMLNKKAARIWEKDKLDFKGRRVTKDAAINDEGIVYVDYDVDKQVPINEIIKKNDIYYGNENDDDIQNQPYILIRKRVPVTAAIEMAEAEGHGKDKTALIIGDNDTFEESGEAAKYELDNMVTIITKMWKEKGTVHFSKSTRLLDIKEDTDSGLTYYPVAHLNWEEKEGSARGEGEVRYLIPNQIEVNRTEVRRVLAVKYQAYPQKIVNTDKIANPSALNQVGGVIKTKGNSTVEDVHKIVGTIPPAQMSPDVKLLQDDLINVTRDLAGAGDAATGQVDPESASGRAILAVQQASQSPMTEQKESYKNFLEDLAKIWLDMMIVYSQDGLKLEEEVVDPMTGETTVQIVDIPQTALRELQAVVKVDITPKGAFDKYAQEISIENMFQSGLFNVQKLSELKIYVKLLDDDSVMPKAKLEEAVRLMEEEQQKIVAMDAEAKIMQQRANQFLMGDPDAQASQMAESMAPQGVPMEAMPMEEEMPMEDIPEGEEVVIEDNPDDN